MSAEHQTSHGIQRAVLVVPDLLVRTARKRPDFLDQALKIELGQYEDVAERLTDTIKNPHLHDDDLTEGMASQMGTRLDHNPDFYNKAKHERSGLLMAAHLIMSGRTEMFSDPLLVRGVDHLNHRVGQLRTQAQEERLERWQRVPVFGRPAALIANRVELSLW